MNGTTVATSTTLPRSSFLIYWNPVSSDVVDEYLYLSWAYTAA